MASLPDVPTAAEVGMPSLDIGVWFGLYAPLGTPKPILDQLNKALRDVVAGQGRGAQLEKIETYLLPLDQATPEAHRRKLASQIDAVAADHRKGRHPGGVGGTSMVLPDRESPVVLSMSERRRSRSKRIMEMARPGQGQPRGTGSALAGTAIRRRFSARRAGTSRAGFGRLNR